MNSAVPAINAARTSSNPCSPTSIPSSAKSTEQAAEGNPVNPQLRYFDWDRPENNVYQLCEEFEVEREGKPRLSLERPVAGHPFTRIRDEIHSETLPKAVGNA